MKYTYEFLRKCHGLRFKATLNNKHQEGIIKVMSDCVMLCYGDEDYGRLSTFERRDTLSFSEASFRILPSDFEIVPRDPETYKDWQVGDVFISNDRKHIILFRCGEVVTYKERGSIYCSALYTCDELFNSGCRLVLTDIEKQILEERKKEEWEPQDGDICFVRCINKWIFIKKGIKDKTCAYSCLCLTAHYFSIGSGSVLRIADDKYVEELRLATDEEKQQLLDALAKKGKRWNAEEKRIEDIPNPCEFREYDPVLVRDNDRQKWNLCAFERYKEGARCPYVCKENLAWSQCIPYNRDTAKLLNTSNLYTLNK